MSRKSGKFAVLFRKALLCDGELAKRLILSNTLIINKDENFSTVC